MIYLAMLKNKGYTNVVTDSVFDYLDSLGYKQIEEIEHKYIWYDVLKYAVTDKDFTAFYFRYNQLFQQASNELPFTCHLITEQEYLRDNKEEQCG